MKSAIVYFSLHLFHFHVAGRTLRGWFGYEPVLLALGALGLPAAARASRGRSAALLVVPPVFLAVLFLASDGTHVRYILPATVFLARGAAGFLSFFLSTICLPRAAQRSERPSTSTRCRTFRIMPRTAG